MKKTWKKLLAVMLAGVMALSCTVLAGATDPAPDPEETTPPSAWNGVGGVDPQDTGDTVEEFEDYTTPGTQQTQVKYASGSAEGGSRSEGPLPVDPIRIELPTVNAKTLDMILDPHSLITRTGGVRYANFPTEDDGIVWMNFAQDTPLYFLNSIGDPTEDEAEAAVLAGQEDPAVVYRYTDETQTLTITNKSHLDVGVDVTLQVTKNTSDFEFVGSKDDLEEATGAAMYLALKKDDDDSSVFPVEDKTAGSMIGVPTVEIEEDDDLFDAIDAANPGDGAASAETSGYPKAIFQWAKDANAAETQDVANSVKEAFIAAITPEEDGDDIATIAVAYSEDLDEADDDSDVAGFTVTPAAIGTAYKAKAEPSRIENTTRDVNVTVTYYTETGTGASAKQVDVAYVYFVIKAGAIGEYEGEDEATLIVTPPEAVTANAQARFTGSIAQTEGAYVEGWDSNGGYYWQFTEEASDEQLLAWHHVTEDGDPVAAPEAYNSISFSIVGSINKAAEGAKTSPWDGKGGDIELNLIWDVFEVKGDITDSAGGAGSTGRRPTAEVTSPATGTSTTGGLTNKATITWADGTGIYEGYTPTSVTGNVGTFTMTAVTGQTNQFTIKATTTNKTATEVKVVFTKEGAADVEVPLTGWYTGT